MNTPTLGDGSLESQKHLSPLGIRMPIHGEASPAVAWFFKQMEGAQDPQAWRQLHITSNGEILYGATIPAACQKICKAFVQYLHIQPPAQVEVDKRDAAAVLDQLHREQGHIRTMLSRLFMGIWHNAWSEDAVTALELGSERAEGIAVRQMAEHRRTIDGENIAALQSWINDNWESVLLPAILHAHQSAEQQEHHLREKKRTPTVRLAPSEEGWAPLLVGEHACIVRVTEQEATISLSDKANDATLTVSIPVGTEKRGKGIFRSLYFNYTQPDEFTVWRVPHDDAPPPQTSPDATLGG